MFGFVKKLWNGIKSTVKNLIFCEKNEEDTDLTTYKFTDKDKELLRKQKEELHRELQEDLKSKGKYVVRVPKYFLNRKMRRFLKRMGWSNIPPKSTKKEMYYFITGLMRAKMTINKKRKLFIRLMGK